MSATGDVLAPGTRLDGLDIERVLGAGGFGVTYLARDLGLDAWRAVKEYLPLNWGERRQDGTVGPRTGSDAEDYRWGLERFLDEARMLARFKHPHIVQVHRVFEAGGTAYMVMEYVEGRTLASVADAEGPLGESRVRAVLGALTDGLSSVHAAGLLHRDISPDNVMVRPDGTPVLIDFGAARHGLGEHSGALSSVLKPGYAPLEQYPPGRGQGPWTDIYGLGALAYWALSGSQPTAATERTRRDPLRPLSEVATRRVSSGLSSAVEAALSVYSEGRPQSLDEWRKLLEEEPAPAPAPAPAPRRWWPAASVAVGLAAAVLSVALLAPWDGGLPDGEPAASAALTEAGGTGGSTVARSSVEETPAAGGGGVGSVGGDEDGGGGAGAEPEGAGPGREEPAVAGPPPDEVERGLGLDRAAWQEIQEGLTASGFDPGAADGLVGGATRSALRAWQSSRGALATGYVDAAAATALRESAQDAARVADQRRTEREAAEREAEAQRQAALEAEAQRQAALEAEAQRQAALEAEAQRQAALEAEAQRQAALEAEAQRQAALEAEAQRQAALEAEGGVFRDCPSCPEMVVLPGGDLAMGRYEVTVGEYRAFVSATGGTGNDAWRDHGRFPQTDSHPVVFVSWDDAQEYVSWLSRRTGATYRLPTEAEWERAAAGSQPGCDLLGRGTSLEETCLVGSYGSNAAGLSDMVGNVWEWTSGCWEGNCDRRVIRGASYGIIAEGVRPDARWRGATAARDPAGGLRVSRTLD